MDRDRPWRPTPAELRAARGTAIPDLIAPGLAVLFCGINPGLYSGATGRHFAKIISGCVCLIGYIMAAFTERKQALHDIIAGTIVVEGKAEDAAQQQAAGQYPGQYPYPPR